MAPPGRVELQLDFGQEERQYCRGHMFKNKVMSRRQMGVNVRTIRGHVEVLTDAT